MTNLKINANAIKIKPFTNSEQINKPVPPHCCLHCTWGSPQLLYFSRPTQKPSKTQILLENYVPACISSFLLLLQNKKNKKAQKKEYLSELVLVLVLLISPGKQAYEAASRDPSHYIGLAVSNFVSESEVYESVGPPHI